MLYKYFNRGGAADLYLIDTSKMRAHVVQLFSILKVSASSLHNNVHGPRSGSNIKLFRRDCL